MLGLLGLRLKPFFIEFWGMKKIFYKIIKKVLTNEI